MHGAAGFANISFAVVTLEDTARDGRRALTAELLEAWRREVEVGIVAHRPVF
jgi:hypothetical protein